jgi:hypothetical protein
MLRRACTVGVFAAAMAASTVAHADPTEAEKRLSEGNELLGAGKREEALSKFVQSCALVRAEPCARQIALLELDLGRLVEGQRDLAAYLARWQPEDRAALEARAKAAWEKTGHLKITAEPGAELTIDGGEPVGVAPLPGDVPVTPGKHTVLAKRKGVSFGRDVDAPAGKTTAVDLGDDDEDEEPDPKKPKPKPPTQKVRTSGAWIAGGILGGIGVVGIGIGIGAAVASHAAHEDVARLYTPGVCAAPSATCNRYRDAVGSQNTAVAISITGYVGAGLFIATGVLVWAIWPKAERPIVAPIVTPTSIGAALTGRF